MRDGYHTIETLFAFARDGDVLALNPATELSLTIGGRFGAGLSAGPDNLVMRAAAALQVECGVTAGAALHLDKQLPVAAGIGGGSADAAATLRLLARQWRIADPAVLQSIAARLGADIPACLESKIVRGDSRGDVLSAVDDDGLAGMALLLVNPGIPLATGPVFAGWGGIDRGALKRGPVMAVARDGRNDLEEAAIALCPEVRSLLDALAEQPGVGLARMSGSGATCFALFESGGSCRSAAAAIATRFPSYWCLETTLR